MKKKRILAMLLAVVILTSTLATAQYESVKSAEWVAGAVTAIGGGPILTALLVGGCVVAGGIAISEIVNSTPEDRQAFVNGIKEGFNDFIIEYEKNQLIQDNAQMSEQQAIATATATATATISDFTNNVINQTQTTGKNLKNKTVELWQKYCQEINDVCDNGVGSGAGTGGPITATSPIFNPVTNGTSYNLQSYAKDSVGSKGFYMNGKYYLNQSQKVDSINGITPTLGNISIPNNNYYHALICYIVVKGRIEYYINCLEFDIDFSLRDYSTQSFSWYNPYNGNDYVSTINVLINNTELPTFVVTGDNDSYYNQLIRNNPDLASVSNTIGGSVPQWKQGLADTMSDTAIGSAIQTGRRQLVNSGDYVGSIFVEDSIPIKKSGLKVNEGTAVGSVGWDVPASDVWDDYLAGNIPFPDVVGGTGTIVVPRPNVTDYPSDSTVSIPSDSTVTDSNPAIDDPNNPSGETTPEDVSQDQAGDFYPTALDLTNIFPFCIPFDLIYIVQQYADVEARAPVIHFVIPYPNAIKGVLGDSYEFELDFADFVSVRNVLRVFILLFFLIGLIKKTRDLIRG